MAKVILLVGLFVFVAVQLSYAAPNPDDATAAPAKSPADTTPPPAKKPAADITPPPQSPEVPAAPARSEDFEKEHRKAFKPILRTIDVTDIPDTPELPDLSNIPDLPKGLPDLSNEPDLPEGLPLSDVPDLPDDIKTDTKKRVPKGNQQFSWSQYLSRTQLVDATAPSSKTTVGDTTSPFHSPETFSVEAKPDAAEAARAAVKTDAPAEAKA